MVHFERFFKVLGMLNALTFYAKVADNQAECNGKPLVTPKSWSVLSGVVSKLIKS